MLGFGKILRSAREAQGLSRTELARLVNVSTATVAGFEYQTLEPSKEQLRRFEEHLPGLKDSLDRSPYARLREPAARGAEVLKGIEKEIHGGNVERLSVRHLLGWFGVTRRDVRNVWEIRIALRLYDLTTKPDFETVHPDEVIEIIPAVAEPPIDRGATTQVEVTPTPPPAADRVAPYSAAAYRMGRLVDPKRKLVTVSPDEQLAAAVSKMRMNDYSQLPVMTSDRDVKGVVSWTSIGTRLADGKPVTTAREFMDDAQEVSTEAHLFKAIPIVKEHQYVLVRAQDRRIAGVVTAYDLLEQYHGLAEPFLLLGEIENHIRRLIGDRFSPQELVADRDPNDSGREIRSVFDLTFGEYVRLLSEQNNWDRLGLAADRKVVIEKLGQVRDVRNDAMHFDPEPLAETDVELLRNVAKYLRGLSDGA